MGVLGKFGSLVGFVQSTIEGLKLPEADPRWNGVATALADVIKDMEAIYAQSDPKIIEAIRITAEIRFTRALHALGLLKEV